MTWNNLTQRSLAGGVLINHGGLKESVPGHSTFWRFRQVFVNQADSGVRCTVERVFGALKQHYGMAKARYLGLSRNRTRTRFELMCVAHNLKRGVSVQQASCA